LIIYQPIITAVLLFASIEPCVNFYGNIGDYCRGVLKKKFEATGRLKIAGVISLEIGGLIVIQPLASSSSLAMLIRHFSDFRGIINLLISFGVKYNRKEPEALVDA